MAITNKGLPSFYTTKYNGFALKFWLFWATGKHSPAPNSITLDMENVCSSKMVEQTHYSTWCKRSDNHHLNNSHHKNLKT
jgi:hypothetical protein